MLDERYIRAIIRYFPNYVRHEAFPLTGRLVFYFRPDLSTPKPPSAVGKYLHVLRTFFGAGLKEFRFVFVCFDSREYESMVAGLAQKEWRAFQDQLNLNLLRASWGSTKSFLRYLDVRPTASTTNYVLYDSQSSSS